MDVVAILLVPSPEYAYLLNEGACGARPPVAWWAPSAAGIKPGHPDWYEENRSVYLSEDEAMVWLDNRRGLVLAWNGKPVAEGLDRAIRAINLTRERAKRSGVFTMSTTYQMREAEVLWGLPLQSLGTLVLLDAEGQEITTTPDQTPSAPDVDSPT